MIERTISGVNVLRVNMLWTFTREAKVGLSLRLSLKLSPSASSECDPRADERLIGA
jgi:hypothetical protein